MTVIKYQNLFDLNSSSSSHTVLLTKVFSGGPCPSHSSVFPFLSLSFCFDLYISFFLITNCSAQSQYWQWHKKKEMKSGSKEGLKTDRNSEILKVASGLLSCFSPLGSFVRNCNRTSGGKIKSLFCYQNTETWPWVSKASEQNRIVIE